MSRLNFGMNSKATLLVLVPFLVHICLSLHSAHASGFDPTNSSCAYFPTFFAKIESDLTNLRAQFCSAPGVNTNCTRPGGFDIFKTSVEHAPDAYANYRSRLSKQSKRVLIIVHELYPLFRQLIQDVVGNSSQSKASEICSLILSTYQENGIPSLDSAVTDFASIFNSAASRFTSDIQPAIEKSIIFEATWHPRNLTKFPPAICPSQCDTDTCPGVNPGSRTFEKGWHTILALLKSIQVSVIQAGTPCHLRSRAIDSPLLLQECVDESSMCHEILYEDLIQYDPIKQMDALVQNLKFIG